MIDNDFLSALLISCFVGGILCLIVLFICFPLIMLEILAAFGIIYAIAFLLIKLGYVD